MCDSWDIAYMFSSVETHSADPYGSSFLLRLAFCFTNSPCICGFLTLIQCVSKFYKLKHELSMRQHPLLHKRTMKKWMCIYYCIDDPPSSFFHIKFSTTLDLLMKLHFMLFCISSNRYFCLRKEENDETICIGTFRKMSLEMSLLL